MLAGIPLLAWWTVSAGDGLEAPKVVVHFEAATRRYRRGEDRAARRLLRLPNAIGQFGRLLTA